MCEKGTKVDGEYMLNNTVCHEGRGTNTKYVVRLQENTAARDPIKPSVKHNVPSPMIMSHLRKRRGQNVKGD